MTRMSDASTIHAHQAVIARSARPVRRGIVAGASVAIERAQRVKTLGVAGLRHSKPQTRRTLVTRTTSQNARCATIGSAICVGCVADAITPRTRLRRFYRNPLGDRSYKMLQTQPDTTPLYD